MWQLVDQGIAIGRQHLFVNVSEIANEFFKKLVLGKGLSRKSVNNFSHCSSFFNDIKTALGDTCIITLVFLS